ncbi:hypothetical protein EVB68_053 [Rhizobium phage RHph_Y2_6]|uniref:Uncharacterized protein n=1 Tax=Rhizobium phage RHph_Y2_6 TaxID=2509576 RepID=A0A7S5USC1_9CAUD|nr:hypothetical protein PP748_gp053 [Rhizobium phage RHph_Y2_6]QIG68790.1 hypothetical protein EVB68_053 [Rhizobium phage RHph_Y2_6]
MYLGGKTRNKHDHIPTQGRQNNALQGREIFKRIKNEAPADVFEPPLLEFLDSSPSPEDLLVSGAFGQKLNFSY